MKKIIKRDTNGQIIYKGIRIDMYLLCQWIMIYNRKTSSTLTPGKIESKHIELFNQKKFERV